MNIRRPALACLVLAAVVTAACSDAPGTPTSPSANNGSLALTAEQLGGTWTLTSIVAAGQAAQAAPTGATYTLSFADGRLSTRADCNTCVGGFTLAGSTLNAGPALACTRAACPTMAFESVYTGILSGESTVTLSGHSLVLSSARGNLYFTR
jgi:heat shock protein HslJ